MAQNPKNNHFLKMSEVIHALGCTLYNTDVVFVLMCLKQHGFKDLPTTNNLSIWNPHASTVRFFFPPHPEAIFSVVVASVSFGMLSKRFSLTGIVNLLWLVSLIKLTNHCLNGSIDSIADDYLISKEIYQNTSVSDSAQPNHTSQKWNLTI